MKRKRNTNEIKTVRGDFMHGDKYCSKCGKYMGNYMIDDYYSLIRKRYCSPNCAEAVKAELNAERLRAWRKKQKERKEDK